MKKVFDFSYLYLNRNIMNQQFISVDWGTTHLRVHLVKCRDAAIIQSFTSVDGVKWMHAQCPAGVTDRITFFLLHLKTIIDSWKSLLHGDESIFISGMASSTIGMRQLPYAELPFYCSGAGLHVEVLNQSLLRHPVFLVSGVRSLQDVMRGEETQILGLLEGLNQADLFLVLPGTHSKHIQIKNEKIIDFQTFMTGEIFDVIAHHTILKESIHKDELNATNENAFRMGVIKSVPAKLLNELFHIRTADLFQQKSKSENYYFLSGLLIGQELRNLSEHQANEIWIGATGTLASLYKLGADILTLPVNQIDEESLSKAVVNGHKKLSQLMNRL